MYKLDPALPLLWRTPFCLQIGVDPAVVILDKLYPSEERFIHAVQLGLADASIPAVADEYGLTSDHTAELLERLSPALLVPTPPSSMRIALDGEGPFVESLGLLLIAMGHRVLRSSAASSLNTDLAIVVADFVMEPHRTGGWLRREVPHLPIVFTEKRIHIGPILATELSETRHTPCYECIELHHRDSEEAWVALATQLLGKESTLHSPLIHAEVASLVARWIDCPESVPVESNQAVIVTAGNSQRELATYSLHPECACQALPRNVIVLGSEHGQFPALPMTVKAAS